MRARAVFPNGDLTLTPGQFGRLRMPASNRYQAILIPDEAVGTDQTERIVYIVGDDKKATPRPVTLGPLVGGLRVVRKGITAQDWIIVKGIGTVRAGMVVNPTQMTEQGQADPPAP
jgi:multidrug efflux pump subunit AcrA (membrane-fusion protein)